jgi:hypothetical protein
MSLPSGSDQTVAADEADKVVVGYSLAFTRYRRRRPRGIVKE